MIHENPSRTPIAFTRGHCALLERGGLLPERYELIEGRIYETMGQNLRLGNGVMNLLLVLVSIFGADFVLTQFTIDVSPADNPTSEPEPDAIVLSVPRQQLTTNPSVGEIRLVAEISDSSLSFDRSVKASLYARANLREYWVLDLVNRQLIVHREPQWDGSWASVRELSETESVAPLGGEQAVAVSELLP